GGAGHVHPAARREREGGEPERGRPALQGSGRDEPGSALEDDDGSGDPDDLPGHPRRCGGRGPDLLDAHGRRRRGAPRVHRVECEVREEPGRLTRQHPGRPIGRPGRICTCLHRFEPEMAWLILFVAGLFEVGWAVGLKYTDGFTRLWPTVGTAAALVLSMGLLGLALRWLPLGTAYAVWTGIGTVGTAILGIVLFREP